MDTCQQLTEKVTDYLEGDQSWSDWAQLKLHVAMCPPCKAYLRQVELSVETLRSTPREDVPDEVRTALLDRYREWQKGLATE